MKIKELFETSSAPQKETSNCDVTFRFTRKPDEQEKDLIIAKVKALKTNDMSRLSVRIDFNQMTVIIDFTYKKLIAPEEISKLENSIIETISAVVPDIQTKVEHDSVRILINYIPDFFIKCHDVNIVVQQPNSSLKSLEKYVECEHLVIANCHHVSSGVLSLLKMKNNTIGFFQAINDPKTNKWIDIIKANIPTHDILSAQEQLIDAGLKDYK